MGTYDKPVNGILQPGSGRCCFVQLPHMGRPKKPTRQAIDDEHDLAVANVSRRLREMWPNKTDTDRYKLLQGCSGVGTETIRKFMTHEQSPRLETLVKIAVATSLTLPLLFGRFENPTTFEAHGQTQESQQLQRRRG